MVSCCKPSSQKGSPSTRCPWGVTWVEFSRRKELALRWTGQGLVGCGLQVSRTKVRETWSPGRGSRRWGGSVGKFSLISYHHSFLEFDFCSKVILGTQWKAGKYNWRPLGGSQIYKREKAITTFSWVLRCQAFWKHLILFPKKNSMIFTNKVKPSAI